MTTTTAITSILGGGILGGSPTDQGQLGLQAPGGGSPTDQGVIGLLYPNGGSPTDQGNPPPLPIERLIAITSSISFTDLVTTVKTLNLDSSNTVGFGDTTEDATKYAFPQSLVSFGQILDAVRVLNVSVGNLITFGQQTQRTYAESVANSITFADDSFRKITAENLVTFSQQIIADVSTPIGNTVVFDSTVATTKILNISISNLVTFSSFTAAAIDRICDRHQFASLTLPQVTFTPRSTILLQCDVDMIELRNPELGNSESTDPKRALNETRYGSLTLYRNPVWPKKTVLEFDLTAITQLKAFELHDFLFNCLGKEVTLTDHESRVWVGVITNPEAVINELRDDGCNYASSLIFEGEPQ